MQQKHVISCDWGTSLLRLQLIDTASQKCLAKVSSGRGNAAIFDEWKIQTDSDRVKFYLKYLQHFIKELSASAGISLDDVCIVISGMASSSVGIKELPYADVPFNLDGSSAYAEWLNTTDIMDNPILLISGVQQSDDVMRGEETQLAGIASLLNFDEDDNLVCILPGTHSKHIEVKKNMIKQFRTFMTGEMFEILTSHSILSHAVSAPKRHEMLNEEKDAFKQGVEKALQSELLNGLFSVRINQLKKYFSPEQNYFFLSGLVIGSELKYINENDYKNLVLCSSDSLLQLYQMAIGCVGLLERTKIVSAETLDKAAAAGQMMILNNINSKTV